MQTTWLGAAGAPSATAHDRIEDGIAESPSHLTVFLTFHLFSHTNQWFDRIWLSESIIGPIGVQVHDINWNLENSIFQNVGRWQSMACSLRNLINSSCRIHGPRGWRFIFGGFREQSTSATAQYRIVDGSAGKSKNISHVTNCGVQWGS